MRPSNHFSGKNKKSKKAKLETDSSADEQKMDDVAEPVEKVSGLRRLPFVANK